MKEEIRSICSCDVEVQWTWWCFLFWSSSSSPGPEYLHNTAQESSPVTRVRCMLRCRECTVWRSVSTSALMMLSATPSLTGLTSQWFTGVSAGSSRSAVTSSSVSSVCPEWVEETVTYQQQQWAQWVELGVLHWPVTRRLGWHASLTLYQVWVTIVLWSTCVMIRFCNIWW